MKAHSGNAHIQGALPPPAMFDAIDNDTGSIF